MAGLGVLTQLLFTLWASRAFALAPDPCPVEIGEVEAKGYEDELALRIAHAHREQLCRCVFTPPKSGSETILLEYVITSTGTVGRAHVQDTTAATMTAECMANVVETWTFPRGPCGVAIVQQRINLN